MKTLPVWNSRNLLLASPIMAYAARSEPDYASRTAMHTTWWRQLCRTKKVRW